MWYVTLEAGKARQHETWRAVRRSLSVRYGAGMVVKIRLGRWLMTLGQRLLSQTAYSAVLDARPYSIGR